MEKTQQVLGHLISQLNHPVMLSYKGQGMKLSSRQKSVLLDRNQLGAIPKGVKFLEKRRA